MPEKKEYCKIQRVVLEWIPKNIIDSHVHTATKVYKFSEEEKKRFKLSYNLMKDGILNFNQNAFEDVFPNKKLKIIGFPLPVPFKQIDPVEWNNKLMIKEMKKGIYGLMIGMDNIKELENTINIAKRNGLKFYGIKFHPRIIPEKPEKKTVKISQMVKDEMLDFIEKHRLTAIIEFSRGFIEEDAKYIKHIDENYNISVVVPHLGFNYLGYVIKYKEYINSLKGSAEKFEAELKKLQECNNIYFDTAMVVDKRIVQATLNIFGEEKVIYGSDFPFCFSPKIKEQRPNPEKVGRILRNIVEGKQKDKWKYDYNIYLQILAIIDAEKSLNMDIKEKIMYNNAKKVFKLE